MKVTIKRVIKIIRNFSTWYMVSGDVIQLRGVMFNFPLNTTKVNPEGSYIKSYILGISFLANISNLMLVKI